METGALAGRCGRIIIPGIDSSSPQSGEGGDGLAMTILYDPACEAYQTNGHPESPVRVRATADYLRERHPAWTWQKPIPAEKADLLRAHDEAHERRLRESEENFFDGDTPNYFHLVDHAARAAGGALQAARGALSGDKTFSLLRPPGHHATRKKPMGFCYMNSIAIAALALTESGKRVGIWDFDAHHGNGTEDIVRGHPYLWFASVHQVPGYPGTGLISGDNIRNDPVAPMTSNRLHLEKLREGLDWLLSAQPDLILVSAGFDAYAEDPLTQLTLTREDFGTMGQWLRELPCPLAAILEGGYSAALPQLVEAFLTGWEG